MTSHQTEPRDGMTDAGTASTHEELIAEARRWPRELEGKLINDLADALARSQRAQAEPHPNGNDEYAKMIEEFSMAMPGEHEFSSNIDGSEESEILAFIEWATRTHKVIHSAREARDFDADGSLRFVLDDTGMLTEDTPTPVTAVQPPANAEQLGQAIANFFWQSMAGDDWPGTVSDVDRNVAAHLLTKFTLTAVAPDIVSTDAELDALLPGSAILDKDNTVWFKHLTRGDPRWHSTDYGALDHPRLYAPFTVLHRATKSKLVSTAPPTEQKVLAVLLEMHTPTSRPKINQCSCGKIICETMMALRPLRVARDSPDRSPVTDPT